MGLANGIVCALLRIGGANGNSRSSQTRPARMVAVNRCRDSLPITAAVLMYKMRPKGEVEVRTFPSFRAKYFWKGRSPLPSYAPSLGRVRTVNRGASKIERHGPRYSHLPISLNESRSPGGPAPLRSPCRPYYWACIQFPFSANPARRWNEYANSFFSSLPRPPDRNQPCGKTAMPNCSQVVSIVESSPIPIAQP